MCLFFISAVLSQLPSFKAKLTSSHAELFGLMFSRLVNNNARLTYAVLMRQECSLQVTKQSCKKLYYSGVRFIYKKEIKESHLTYERGIKDLIIRKG